MTASALHYMGAAEQARRVKAREVSAREVTRAHLDRIAAVDARLGAFLHVDAASALARADEIDQAVARGEDPGPLAGVSIALKDVLVTRGMPTTAASRILDGWIPPYDGTAVARLRAAGAVLLGKLNMDEFAMGSSTENSSVRPCANPWDLARVPGGSSGGSAAAVAAGLCAASLGTDTGGSIRQPAALCGVVGLKPTYGRVSRYGVVAFASSLDQVGPLGRSVEDVALMLDAIAGFDPHDSTSITEAPPGFAAALDGGDARGLVIGRPREYDLPGVEPEVAAAVDRAVEVLVSLGAEVREVSLPHAEFALPTYYLLAPAEASSNLARYDGVRYGARTGGADGLADMYARTRGAGFGAEVKRRIMLGTFALRSGYYDAYYKKAQQVRALIARDFARAFDSGVHLIASPTSPTAAFRLGEKAADPMAMYLADVFTLSCNLAGLPGISVPCGQTGAGLPVGLQLVGRALDEVTVLRAAAAYEAAGGHAARRPPEEALRRGSPQANDDDAPAATSSGDLSGGTR